MRPIPEGLFDAATIPALAKLLGAARHDTSGLTAAQLIALDYKSAVATDGTKIGAASILTPFGDFEARAGGSEALAVLLKEEASSRNVDVLFAMCQTDPSTKKRGLAYAGRAVESVERGFEGAPDSLPDALRTAALFVEQKIASDGFGAAFVDRGGLRHSELRPQTSRKTVLPAILHFLS